MKGALIVGKYTEVAVIALTVVGAGVLTFFALSSKPKNGFTGTINLKYVGLVSKSGNVIVEKFALENKGSQKLTALKIVPSCGCTTVDAPDEVSGGTVCTFMVTINRSPSDSAIPLGLGIISGRNLVQKFVVKNYTEVEAYNPSMKYEEPDCKAPKLQASGKP